MLALYMMSLIKENLLTLNVVKYQMFPSGIVLSGSLYRSLSLPSRLKYIFPIFSSKIV